MFGYFEGIYSDLNVYQPSGSSNDCGRDDQFALWPESYEPSGSYNYCNTNDLFLLHIQKGKCWRDIKNNPTIYICYENKLKLFPKHQRERLVAIQVECGKIVEWLRNPTASRISNVINTRYPRNYLREISCEIFDLYHDIKYEFVENQKNRLRVSLANKDDIKATEMQTSNILAMFFISDICSIVMKYHFPFVWN